MTQPLHPRFRPRPHCIIYPPPTSSSIQPGSQPALSTPLLLASSKVFTLAHGAWSLLEVRLSWGPVGPEQHLQAPSPFEARNISPVTTTINVETPLRVPWVGGGGVKPAGMRGAAPCFLELFVNHNLIFHTILGASSARLSLRRAS